MTNYKPASEPPPSMIDVINEKGIVCYFSSWRQCYVDSKTYKPIECKFWANKFNRNALEDMKMLNDSI